MTYPDIAKDALNDYYRTRACITCHNNLPCNKCKYFGEPINYQENFIVLARFFMLEHNLSIDDLEMISLSKESLSQ